MDFNLNLCPATDKFDYFARDGKTWSCVETFLLLQRAVGHEQCLLKIADPREVAFVMTPECAINLGRAYELIGRNAATSNHVIYYRSSHPISLLLKRESRDKTPVLLVKTGHDVVKFLLIMLSKDFYKNHQIFADRLSLDFSAAFEPPKMEIT